MLADIPADRYPVDFRSSRREAPGSARVSRRAKVVRRICCSTGSCGIGGRYGHEGIPPHTGSAMFWRPAVALIDDPEIDLEGLMKHIHGPDFPTAGPSAADGGHPRGVPDRRCKVSSRAKYEIEELKDWRSTSSSPRARLRTHQGARADPVGLAALVNGDRVTGVSRHRDESSTARLQTGLLSW